MVYIYDDANYVLFCENSVNFVCEHQTKCNKNICITICASLWQLQTFANEY